MPWLCGKQLVKKCTPAQITCVADWKCAVYYEELCNEIDGLAPPGATAAFSTQYKPHTHSMALTAWTDDLLPSIAAVQRHFALTIADKSNAYWLMCIKHYIQITLHYSNSTDSCTPMPGCPPAAVMQLLRSRLLHSPVPYVQQSQHVCYKVLKQVRPGNQAHFCSTGLMLCSMVVRWHQLIGMLVNRKVRHLQHACLSTQVWQLL